MDGPKQSILVTGASGFIGGRLAESLASQEGTRVTGMGRTFPEEQALRAAGVDLAVADLRDGDALALLCEGKQVVFHVAAWMGRDGSRDKEAHAVNVDATRVLAERAAAAGVRRMVLVSTVAVYGLPAGDEVDEGSPLDVKQRDVYGRTKALGEQAAREIAGPLRSSSGGIPRRTGLELAIVRPAMVYGPRSAGWTVGMLKLVRKGVPVLFGEAGGFAFPIYVDDVVDMLRLCGARPEASGEAFNASAAPVTWAEFMGFYGRMCGRSPRRLPLWLARALAAVNGALHLGLPLTSDRLRYYTRRLRFSTAKAERLLGWKSAVPIAEGMKRSEEWLRRTGRL